MPLIDDIKIQYPHPRKPGDLIEEPDAQAYCVGGAVCHYTGEPFNFPGISTLAKALRRLNRTLPLELSFGYARLITENNDLGQFAEAWTCVDSAITYEVATDSA